MKTLLDQWRFVLMLAHDKRLSRGDLAVAIYLVDHLNKEKGVAWPSYNRLAECASIARSNAVVSVKKLTTLGYFNQVTGGGRGRSNRYTPNTEIIGPISQSPPPKGASKQSCPQVQNSPAHRHKTVPPTGTEPTYPCEVTNVAGVVGTPPRRASAGATAPPHGAPRYFDNFWQAYPKKEGRKPAIKAYQDAIATGVSPDILIAKAAQYAEAKATVDTQYLKMPANWLKDECWLEDPQPPKPKTPRRAKDKRKTKLIETGKGQKADSTNNGRANSRRVGSNVVQKPIQKCRFNPNERVRHLNHGLGRVTSTEGKTVNVIFDSGKRKRIRDMDLLPQSDKSV